MDITLQATQTNATIPLWLKAAFTAFMAVLVPVYYVNYGPTNFIYFCDAALFLTLFGIWANNALAISMAAVGILLPQFFWCLDYGAELIGIPATGMTAYMFNSNNSLFLRGLSLFHGWLPFLLTYLVLRMGYDKRALKAWTVLAVVLCLIAYFLLPPAGAALSDPNLPRNVNYVFGLNDAEPQMMLPPALYGIGWVIALFTLAYLPTHCVLIRFMVKRT